MASENALQKQKTQAETGLANAPVKKKIGFFSAMMVVVGSSVGAGIFFKAGAVLNNSQGSIIFAMFCWLLAGFAVISMGLALIEIASARNDNLSIIGWCQTFNSRLVYKACKNFMVYIYLPLTYFFMPLYVVMSIQDGVMGVTNWDGTFVGANIDWLILMAITIGMSVYFIVACGLSSKLGNIQNWAITSVKFVPLILAVAIGIWFLASNGHVANPNTGAGFKKENGLTNVEMYTFSKMTPGFGMFIAIAAIFFAYDGFYVAAGLQTEMKEPKKTPMAILFGLIIVTVIYLLIAVAMSLGSEDGSPFGYQKFLASKNAEWLYGLFQILIGIGVIGIINGFALWSTRFIEDLIRANEVPLSYKFVNKLDDHKPVIGIMYNLVISLPIIVVFCIIGGLGYVNAGYGYAESANKLYSFADLMGTWTALIAFGFIIFAIAGGLKNRKTNNINVQKSKFFVPTAIISIITVSLPLFFTLFEPIANLFFLFRIDRTTANYTTDVLVPRVMVVAVLFIFAGLMLLPEWIENLVLKHKYGSIDEGLVEKTRIMARAKGISLEREIINNVIIDRRTFLLSYEKLALGRDQLTKKEIALINNEAYIEENDNVSSDDLNIQMIPTYLSLEQIHIHSLFSDLDKNNIVEHKDWDL